MATRSQLVHFGDGEQNLLSNIFVPFFIPSFKITDATPILLLLFLPLLKKMTPPAVNIDRLKLKNNYIIS
jgi:hypothetical protein